MNRVRTATLAAALLLPWGPIAAQEAEEVVARHTEALGGIEAIRSIDSLRKTGIYVYNGLEHPVVVVQKRGAGCREEIEGLTQWGTSVESGRTVIRAWNGDEAWVAAGSDAEPMPEAELPGFLLDAEVESSLIAPAEKGHRLEALGTSEIEGVEGVELRLTRRDGRVETWYLDPETYLPLSRTTPAPEGEYKAAMTWYFDDYREVAGVQMPFYVLIEEPLFSREYIFDEIEVNPSVEDALFSRP